MRRQRAKAAASVPTPEESELARDQAKALSLRKSIEDIEREKREVSVHRTRPPSAVFELKLHKRGLREPCVVVAHSGQLYQFFTCFIARVRARLTPEASSSVLCTCASLLLLLPSQAEEKAARLERERKEAEAREEEARRLAQLDSVTHLHCVFGERRGERHALPLSSAVEHYRKQCRHREPLQVPARVASYVRSCLSLCCIHERLLVHISVSLLLFCA